MPGRDDLTTLQAISGKFAFRFNGFRMNSNNPDASYLVGLGILYLDEKGAVSGRLTSSVSRVSGIDAKLLYSIYSLSGSVEAGSDGSGKATIVFAPETPEVRRLTGHFDLIVVDASRILMISTGATADPPGNHVPDEVVSGEAIWMA